MREYSTDLKVGPSELQTQFRFRETHRNRSGSGLVANTAGFREQSSDGTEGMVSSNAGCDANRLLKHRSRIIVRPVANQRSIWDLRPFRFSRGGPGSGSQKYCSLVSPYPIRLQRCQSPRPSFSGTCNCASGNLFVSGWPLDQSSQS